ncbi:zinc-dependent alcohol dehydrogenase [Acrocarpospora catenulata]|uniref:zinc-dependent alcohol dehydrogenase n=1 Tax=Acrocarpospora catenulata TaxID=2836182 RepID=UPI001BDA3074|nr:alcohol dehydrogenase catalytic domain-containing protein [Acrocarpospora catenulata]
MPALVKLSHSPRDVAVVERSRPVPAAGELLVRTEANGLCGSDVHAWKQDAGYEWLPDSVVLGHEAVGVVDGLGDGVEESWLGRRIVPISIDGCGECAVCRTAPHLCPRRDVMGLSFDGAAAGWFTIDADRVIAVPDDVPVQALVLTEPLAIAAHAVGQLRMPADGRPCDIVVTGPGPIGIMAAMLLHGQGHRVTLVGIARDQPVRLATASELGLRTSLGEDLPDSPPCWLETSGAEEALALAVGRVAMAGTIVVLAMFSRPPVVDVNIVTRRELTVLGSYGATRKDYELAVDTLRQDPGRWARLATPFALDQAVEALRAVEEGAVVKAVLVP